MWLRTWPSRLLGCSVRCMDEPTWIDLLDPDPESVGALLPDGVHSTVVERLKAAPEHDDEPRPRLETHGDYIFGILVVPVPQVGERRVVYQEVDLVVTMDRLITVRKTPPGGEPLAIDAVRAASTGASAGLSMHK